MSRNLRWIGTIGWILIVIGALLLAVWGTALGRTTLSLRRHIAQVEALADDPMSADPRAACSLVEDLRADVVSLRRYGGGLVQLAPSFGWLPRVGGDLAAAPHLLATADGMTEAGVALCELVGPVLDGPLGNNGSSSESPAAAALMLLTQHRAEMEQALAATERAMLAWQQVDLEEVSPAVAGKLAPVQRGLPLLESGLRAALAAPHLLGADEARTYLVLALNEDELRPGGGFISGVGEIRIEQGRLVEMTFLDSYAADDLSQPYPDPPEPLSRYMGLDLWGFRDSNWSPDFPTAARQALALYRPGHEVTVDGVLAVDQRAVQELVDALGPLSLEGADEPVTGRTIIPYMRDAWAPEGGDFSREWFRQRKSFMGEVAQAAWDQIRRGEVEWVDLAKTLRSLLERKHILVYIEHPDVAALLAEQGWDGALWPGAGDFLMVVDANVGYNKASARVRESITYEVDLGQTPPQATATLVYTHTSTVDYPCVPEARYDPVYEQMMNRCYWDYVRLFVPQGSQLVDATQVFVPGQALWSGEPESGEITVRSAEEGPWLTFGVLNLLPPATSQTRRLTWTLPLDVVQWEADEGRYSLRVQKQPGTRGHPLVVRIRLPEGAEWLDVTPEPAQTRGGEIVYSTSLDRDREFSIRFRRPNEE
ncbi:MAG: DUF4012 domain-containing protein [Anaerolineae bacterium]|jgi:hypothetical protein